MGDSNTWEGILKAPLQSRSKLADATVIFAGLAVSGRTSLLDTFCPKMDEEEEEGNDDEKRKDYPKIKPLSFNYFNAAADLDDPADSTAYPVLWVDDADATARVNVWSIDERVTKSNLKLMIEISKVSQAASKYLMAIAVDLSDSPAECIKNLRAWIRKLSKEAESLMTSEDVAAYVRSAKGLKGRVTGSDSSVEQSTLLPFQKLFKIPLVVVATKSDVIRTDDAIAAKAAKDLQGKLRSICLEVGATLVYTSAVDKDSMVNCGTLQRYLLHRLYHDTVPYKNLALHDGLANVFIPSGFDSPELISIATGIKVADVLGSFSDKDELKFAAELFTGDRAHGKAEAATEPAVLAESEAEWLGAMQTYLMQVTGESMVAKQTETTPSRRTLSRPPVAHQDEDEVRAFFKSLLAQGQGLGPEAARFGARVDAMSVLSAGTSVAPKRRNN